MNLNNSVITMRLEISCWGAEKTDRKTSGEVTRQYNAEEGSAKVVKSLLGGKCDSLANIHKIAASARQRIKMITLPYDNGCRMIPLNKANEVLSEFVSLKSKFVEAVRDFLDEYPRLAENARQKLNLLYEECPSLEEVRSKFSFGMTPRPIPSGTLFDDLMDDSPLREQLKEMYEEEQLIKAGEAKKELTDRLVNRLEYTIASLTPTESGKISVREDALANTKEIMAIVQGLNVFGDSQINEGCNSIINTLTYSAKTYRTEPAIREQTKQRLTNILEGLTNE